MQFFNWHCYVAIYARFELTCVREHGITVACVYETTYTTLDRGCMVGAYQGSVQMLRLQDS